MSLALLLDRLDGVDQTGPNSWVALCPLHADTRPSLHIDVTYRDGRPFPLLRCHACGPIFYELTRLFEVAPYTLLNGLRFEPGSGCTKPRKSERQPKPLEDRYIVFLASTLPAVFHNGSTTGTDGDWWVGLFLATTRISVITAMIAVLAVNIATSGRNTSAALIGIAV